jgi:Xaa-Pro dipeptidase
LTDFWYEPDSVLDQYWTNAFDVIRTNDDYDLLKNLKNPERFVYLGSEEELAREYNIKKANINPNHIMTSLKFFRRIKDEYEVHCTEEATKVAYRGHKRARECFYDGFSEFDIHNEYLKASRLLEYDTPYPNIIALNEKSSYLHYDAKRRNKPDTYLSFLIDAGGTYESYTSDVTRTYVSKDKEKTIFGDLIKRMETLQKNVIQVIKNGLSYLELHAFAHKLVSTVLADFDIVNLSPDEIYDRDISSYFLPHGLGHLIGVQVHDVGGYLLSEDGEQQEPPEKWKFLRLTQYIEEGHLFTIEPGLYFNDKLMKSLKQNHSNISSNINWDLINQMKQYGGIRIEDNIYVKKNSIYNITRTIFDM